MPGPSRALNFPVLLGLAWALTAAVLLAERWPEMGLRLFDADDAMRLVQVRDFLAGRGWFDLHDIRIDPPNGYDTHWSRLIDLGLASLYLAFRPFTDSAMAEQLMRAAWPLVWLLVAMGSVAALAWRLGGRNAALIALVLSVCALPAFQHFKPGRIDHHNVQIALALAVVAAAAWSDRARHAAVLAGALTALAMAIGLENILFVALAGAAVTLRFLLAPDDRALAHYGAALAAGALIGFLVIVPPVQWIHPACDALAINWVVPVVVAGAGLWASATFVTSWPARAIAVGVVGAAALIAWLAIEPRCIFGPFALADEAIKLLWLDNVDETESLLSVMRHLPMTGAWLAAFPFVGVLATVVLAREPAMRCDFGFWLAAAALLLAFMLTFGAVKLYAYAMWFGIPAVAAVAAHLTASSMRLTIAIRAAAALLLTPTVVTAGAITIAQAAGGDVMRPGIVDRAICSRNAAYAELARLPAGLVATETNYGPFVLALTPHAVVSAPYHRISSGVVAAHTILHGTPDEARRVVERYGVTYLAICGARTSTGVDPVAGSLWAELRAGKVPVWLAPLTRASDATTFAIFRVLSR
jgi:hypothetical protein